MKIQFYENRQKTHKNTANYLQIKLPLKNELFKAAVIFWF